jgi:transposase-like protein
MAQWRNGEMATLISNVTDAVIDEVKTWQSRQLDAVYPIVYLTRFSSKREIAGT